MVLTHPLRAARSGSDLGRAHGGSAVDARAQAVGPAVRRRRPASDAQSARRRQARPRAGSVRGRQARPAISKTRCRSCDRSRKAACRSCDRWPSAARAPSAPCSKRRVSIASADGELDASELDADGAARASHRRLGRAGMDAPPRARARRRRRFGSNRHARQAHRAGARQRGCRARGHHGRRGRCARERWHVARGARALAGAGTGDGDSRRLAAGP